jgi:septal ring factor EnvC (AmiA/AmiB activator)
MERAMSKTANQKLLRDLNQRIGQLEHEKSLMAEYNGRLEQQLAELEARELGWIHSLSTMEMEKRELQQQLAELREAAVKYSDNGHHMECVLNAGIDAGACDCGLAELEPLLQEQGE